jgi:hypothetical protein
MRERFTNPANGQYYDWPINHDEEAEFGVSRNIEHGANTANTGFVRQQSEDSPLIIKISGAILTVAQHEQFRDWYMLSKDQTIYFRDFHGDEYEVIFTSYKPTRKRTIRNPRGGSVNPYHWYRYDMEMEVIRVISGTWEGVA